MNKIYKIFYYKPVARYIAKNGSEKLGVNMVSQMWSEGSNRRNTELTMYGKTLKEAQDKFNKCVVGCEEVTCSYFLCSQDVVDTFKPFEVSKGFVSGYDDGDRDNLNYVAWLNFSEVQKYYDEHKIDETDRNFWLQEFSGGLMDVTSIKLKDLKNNTFLEIERTLGLTTTKNIALTLNELCSNYGMNPIAFVNKYC